MAFAVAGLSICLYSADQISRSNALALEKSPALLVSVEGVCEELRGEDFCMMISRTKNGDQPLRGVIPEKERRIFQAHESRGRTDVLEPNRQRHPVTPDRRTENVSQHVRHHLRSMRYYRQQPARKSKAVAAINMRKEAAKRGPFNSDWPGLPRVPWLVSSRPECAKGYATGSALPSAHRYRPSICDAPPDRSTLRTAHRSFGQTPTSYRTS